MEGGGGGGRAVRKMRRAGQQNYLKKKSLEKLLKVILFVGQFFTLLSSKKDTKTISFHGAMFSVHNNGGHLPS